MILDEETGQLVLDQSSLTMQAQPREEYLRREDGHHDTVNSMSYMKRETASRWSPEETDEFYAVSASLSPVCSSHWLLESTGLQCKQAAEGAVLHTPRHCCVGIVATSGMPAGSVGITSYTLQILALLH